jgi:receptor tyrosine kinase-like orphan receptor 1
LYLYVAVPAVIALAILGLCIGLCCMRQNRKSSKTGKPGNTAASVGSSGMAPEAQRMIPPFQQTVPAGNVELNSLLSHSISPQQLQQQQLPVSARPRAREFPLSSLRFIEELGEGAFGKVYKGECFGVGVGSGCALVAIKTLKPGAAQKTKSDFQREAELVMMP